MWEARGPTKHVTGDQRQGPATLALYLQHATVRHHLGAFLRGCMCMHSALHWDVEAAIPLTSRPSCSRTRVSSPGCPGRSRTRFSAKPSGAAPGYRCSSSRQAAWAPGERRGSSSPHCGATNVSAAAIACVHRCAQTREQPRSEHSRRSNAAIHSRSISHALTSSSRRKLPAGWLPNGPCGNARCRQQ